MRSIAFLLALTLAAAPARAAFDEAGFSARAIGMGSAWTAVYDDVNAMGYNPASIGQLRRVQASSNYLHEYEIPAGLSDAEQINGNVAVPVDQEMVRGGIGGSWSYTKQSAYSVDRAFVLDYGTRGFQEFEHGNLELGAALKFLNRNYAAGGGAVKATVDLGALYKFWDKYALGFSFLNFNGPTFSNDRVPVTAKIGVSENVGTLTMAMDLSKREAEIYHPGSTNIAGGIENWWSTPQAGSFAARTGLNLGDQGKVWNLGVGWRIFGGELDYAVSIPLVNYAKVGHSLGLVFRFGVSNPEAEYEKLLRDEDRYRKDLTAALEAGEVKQWKLSDELARLREQIEALRVQLAGKIADEKQARAKIQELEERHRRAQESFDKIQAEERRLRAQTKDALFAQDWTSYQKLKQGGAPDAVLLDDIKRMLREYKDAGVDLSAANQELQRLLRGR